MSDSISIHTADNYWLDRLSGDLPVMVLPVWGEADENSGRGSVVLDLAAGTTTELQRVSSGQDMALFVLFLSGVFGTLQVYTGLEDLLVGTMSRCSPGVKDKLLFCRQGLQAGWSFKETVLQVRQTVQDAFANEDYSFGSLFQKLIVRNNGETPALFQVAVVLDSLQNHGSQLRQFDLVLSLGQNENKWQLQADFNKVRYSDELVKRFCENVLHLLDEALKNLDQPLFKQNLLTPQRQAELATFNATAVEYDRQITLPGLFEAQVARTPEAPAVITEQETLRYREVNERANRLSGVLRERGVRQGSVVGVMLERGADLPLTLLAVQKAGAAYLPIDPKTPKNRLVTMLEDAHAAALVTEKGAIQSLSFTALQGLGQGIGKVHFTSCRRQIVDLNSLPFPDRSLVDYETYNKYIGQVMVKHIISLQTARGCPYGCVYCSKVWPRKHVFRSAESIFEELELYYNMGVRRFSIFDDIFNINTENGMRFFRKIIDHKMKVQLFFPNGLRGDLLNKKYIDIMVEAGLVCTAMALETATPRLQKMINKNLDIDKFRANAEYFCTKYPQVVLEMFSIHGFPTETEEEAMSTLNFIKSLKWLHFPYVFILKIYPGTEMAEMAMEQGILREAILKSEDLAFHEMSPTSPFRKSFTKQYQADFLEEYFLNKERLLHVLPYQMKVFTEDEVIQKYDSYLPFDIKSVDDLLKLAGIGAEELGPKQFMPESAVAIPDFNAKLRSHFPRRQPEKDAARVLILDLTQYFSGVADMLYDVVEPPLGAMYVLTYLLDKFAEKINGRIAKSRIDFDSYAALKELLAEFRPDLIGIRGLTFYRDFFHQTVTLIRQWGWDVPIIAGGPYATRNAATLLQDTGVDIVVLSEGETIFAEVVEQFMQSGRKLPTEEVLSRIDGIAYLPEKEREEKAGREVVMLDELAVRLAKQSAADSALDVKGKDPAYVIFTSGSTGTPKGVVVEQSSAVNVVQWFAQRYGIELGKRVVQLTNYTFDPSVEQIFGTLLHGGELYLPERGVIDNVAEFREYLKRHGVQVINFVPGALDELLGYGEKLTSLEAVIAGGEKLERSVKDRLREKGYRVHNHYGPTEVTVDALAGECDGGEVNLGKPIRNVECYIVDSHGRAVPVGVTGELYVSGAGVARGYLNNPELTTERFMEWPAGSGQRVYRTGDLARWLPEGRLEFKGRRDLQVKVRGFRIELGEIESRLKMCDGIRESIVVAIDGVNTGEKQLCAYFAADEEIPAAELRDILSRDLPDYMIPAFFVRLPVLPRLPNGKIDRASLLAPQQTVVHHKYTPPRNKTEEILLAIWSAVLGLPKEDIGSEGNFFELGGDSIKVIQITARLHQHHLKLEGGAIFLHPTIQDLAGHVTGLVRVADQGAVQGLVEFTPEQIRFFTAEWGQRHHFNQAVMLYSATGFAEEMVRVIFGKLIAHHDILRAVYHQQDGHWLQEIMAVDGKVDLEVKNLRGDPEAKHRVTEEADRIQASFDLEHGPLIKLGLFHLDDGDRLLVVVHHLLVDGVSWRILLEDIDILYRHLLAGESLQLPAKTDSFRDWAAALQRYAGSSILRGELEFWQEVEQTKVDLLSCSLGGENLERNSSTVTVILTEEETTRLLGPAHRAFGTDVNDLLLAALAQAFYEIWGLKRVAVALEGHGREFIAGDLDISRTVGWFTSVYPVILEAPADQNSARHIKAIKDRLHRIPRKGIGHGILKFVTPVEKRAGLEFRIQPQVSFNYLGQFDTDTRERSFQIAAESSGRSSNKDSRREFELDVSGLVANQCLRLSLTFGRQRIAKASIEAVLRVFKNSVVALTNFCCRQQEREMTASDFDYKELTGEQLDTIFD